MALSTTQHLSVNASLRRPPNLMVLRPTSPRMETTSLHLSVVDQRTPRVYTQTLLIFPFPDGNKAEAAMAALESGLRETLKKFLFLAGTLSLSEDRSGKLTLTYPTNLPDLLQAGLFSRKTISPDDFDFTYEVLKESGMPPKHFTPELFRPTELLKYAGVPASGEGMVDFSKSDAPVFRSQANFIPGGLVLYMCFHHSVVDCSGISNFWTYLAQEISRSSGHPAGISTEMSLLEVPPDQSKLRHELDELAPSSVQDHPFNADAYTGDTYVYDKTLADDTQCESKILLMPAAKIHAYRNDLRKHFPVDSPPSICNVIAALLWIYVTRARISRIGPCKCTPAGAGHEQSDCEHNRTNIGIATDLRRRRDPQLTSEYMGNLAIFSKGTLSIEQVTAGEHVTEDTVLSVIQEIRRAIGRADPVWVNQQLGFFKSLEQIEDTECALGFRFGRDIYITSWMNFAADLQWNIPGTDMDENSLNGRADYIRRFHNPSDGGLMIMPRRRGFINGVEAPYEILVRLAKVDMDALETGGLREWYNKII